MWPMSGAARLELSRSHTAATKLEVLHSGRPVHELVVTGGSVTAQVGRSVMRNASATAVDPAGQLTGGDLQDLLSPYDCEIAPWRGVRTPAGIEWAPLGVFGLTGRRVAGDGSVELSGQDRAMTYQGPMSGALAVPGGTPVEEAITRLLVTRQPGVQMRSWHTGFTCGPLLYRPDIDVWAEARKLAQSVGGWLHHDRLGRLVFSPLLPTTTTPVARYADGDGVLVEASRSEDADTIHNVVVVRSTDGTIQAVAEDTDPTSPTYAGGRYGRRVTVITNPHVSSVEQAQQAATTALLRELGRSETAALQIVPNPALDPLDAVAVHRPSAGLLDRVLVIDSLTVPLLATELMTLGCRKYLLTRDGQTLETELEMHS